MKTLKRLGRDIKSFFKAWTLLNTILAMLIMPTIGFDIRSIIVGGSLTFIVAFIYAFVREDYVMNSNAIEDDSKLIPRRYKD